MKTDTDEKYFTQEEAMRIVLTHANAISRTFKGLDVGLTTMVLCLLEDAAEEQIPGVTQMARQRIEALRKSGVLQHAYIEDDEG